MSIDKKHSLDDRGSRISGYAAETVLDVRNLSINYRTRFGEINAVRGVSFNVRRGETLAIVGESGCGKSSIAFAVVNFLGMNGVIRNGQILFQNQDMVGRSYQELRRLRGNQVSMVFQDPMQALNPSLCLGRQMIEVLVTHQRLSTREARAKAMAMLRRVHMPDPLCIMARYPHQISGGQQQRIVIAMAMLNNPALLIMDEPTTALDVTVEATVLDLVAELKEAYNTGIIYITHDLGVVARVADRMAVMYAGEIVEVGPADSIFARPHHPYTQGLLRCVPKLGSRKETTMLNPIRGRVPQPAERQEEECSFHPRCDFASDECAYRRPELRTVDLNHRVRCHEADKLKGELSCQPELSGFESLSGKSTISDFPPLLTISNVKTYYRQDAKSFLNWMGFGSPNYVKAVDEVSFEIPRGSVFGLVGESGCGKTTLIKTILGLESATAGQLLFDDQDITRPLRARDLNQVQKIQIVFQNPDATLNPFYSVGDQIARPLLRFGVVSKSMAKERAMELLRAVRLPQTFYERFPRQLSGGEKQRVGLARALASEPELILCDEPVSALDVSVQAAVLKLLLDIQKEFDTTLLFISHDLSVVRFICDTIAVMYLGQLVEIGPTEAVVCPPYHPYTAALLSAVSVPDPQVKTSNIRLSGDVPSAADVPSGCRFHTRCPWRGLVVNDGEKCRKEVPQYKEGRDGHLILCHLNNQQLSDITI
jgi:peptide/nickel transport system ATP-binding protein